MYRVVSDLDEGRSREDVASWGLRMADASTYSEWALFADVVLTAHVAVALFVVLGQIIIVAGGIVGLKWVRHLWFRIAHLTLVMLIAAETWVGAECPLTQLERALRQRSGQTVYTETFTEHWMSPVLFFPAPPWVFILLHSSAALIVFGSLILIPPLRRPDGPRQDNWRKLERS